jgi:multidrug resistance efflux pump
MVDLPLPAPRRRRLPIWAAGVLVALLLGLGVAFFSRGQQSSVKLARVEVGAFSRTVRGVGVLRAAESSLVVAEVPGRVVELRHLVGETVPQGEVLVRLENPRLVQEAAEAQARVSALVHEAAASGATLLAQVLQAEAARVEAESRMRQARAELAAKEALAKEGLLSQLELGAAQAAAEAAVSLWEVAKKREEALLRQAQEANKAQEARLEEARAAAARAAAGLKALSVTSPRPGIVEELSVEAGGWVEAGSVVGKVSNPEGLEAVLEIPQEEAGNLSLGMPVRVFVTEHSLWGVVRGLGPAARQGTVQVLVSPREAWPTSLRPGLTAEGEILVEQKDKALLVVRPQEYRGPGEGFVYQALGSKAVARGWFLGALLAKRSKSGKAFCRTTWWLWCTRHGKGRR